MRVAVTGATGFTGAYLLPELERRGHEAVALTADVTNRTRLHNEMAMVKPDAVVHLAGQAFVHSDDYDAFYTVNQIGSFHLLDAIAAVTPGARVILASTAQVYGAQAAGLLDEERPVRPANHYALSKAAMEIASRFWRDRLEIGIVRSFNYTGVGQQVRYLVPKVVDHFRRRASVIELGNIDVRRDFGDVRSVAEAYALLLTTNDLPDVCNISTGRVRSVRDMIDRLTTITGHDVEIRTNPAFVREDDVPELGGRNDRLRAALPGWTPRDIDETLAWMVDADA